MKTVAVKPMKCEFASEGLLWIDKIATGVGVILFNPQHKFAAGFHVLRGRSKGHTIDSPAYYADTAVDYAVKGFSSKGIPLNLSVAIAGGASLMAGSGMDEVGAALVASVKEALAAWNLVVKIENVGGTRLRSIILNVDEGRIKIS